MSQFEKEPNVFTLVSMAIRNVLDSAKYDTARVNEHNVEALMGTTDFWNKIWTVSDDDCNCVNTVELARLKRFAGPNGYAIWKAWKAQREET